MTDKTLLWVHFILLKRLNESRWTINWFHKHNCILNQLIRLIKSASLTKLRITLSSKLCLKSSITMSPHGTLSFIYTHIQYSREHPPSYKYIPKSFHYTFKYVGHTTRFKIPTLNNMALVDCSSKSITSNNCISASYTQMYSKFNGVDFAYLWTLWEMMVHSFKIHCQLMKRLCVNLSWFMVNHQNLFQIQSGCLLNSSNL